MKFFIALNIGVLLLFSCSSHRNSLVDNKHKEKIHSKIDQKNSSSEKPLQGGKHKANNSSNKNNSSHISGIEKPNLDTLKNSKQKAFKGTGRFKFSMSGYRGELVLSEKAGVISGTLKFHNWGNGVPHPLKDVRLNGNRIFFKRSMETREELKKYGGRTLFKQKFYGIFSPDFSRIKGYYQYLGAQDNWKADK